MTTGPVGGVGGTGGTGGTGGDVVVRAAVAADLDGVVALETHALGRDAWSPALVEAGLSGTLPSVGYLVAEQDSEVVGYAVTSIVGDVAELQRIATAEPARRRGVASSLIARVVATARAAGAERLLLEVREDNDAALALYAAHGLTELHRRRRYYRDGATAVVLARDLTRG